MPYAVCAPADQTYVYLTENGTFTTVHAQAKLFGRREDAECWIAGSDQDDTEVEEVVDEIEFRARKDTW